MGRSPCCTEVGLHRGRWNSKEDKLLSDYIRAHGDGRWKSFPKKAGLLRCGKSCRLRWLNYLRPDIKRGNMTPEEDDIIVRLQGLLGNRWSLIAGRLLGRTDNEIKNYWNTHLSKRRPTHVTDPIKSPQASSKRRRSSKNSAKMEPTVYTYTYNYTHKPLRVTPQQYRSECVLPVTKTASLRFDRMADAMEFIEKLCDGNDHDDDVDVSNAAMGIHGSLQTLYEEYTQLLKPSTSTDPRQE